MDKLGNMKTIFLQSIYATTIIDIAVPKHYLPTTLTAVKPSPTSPY